MLMYFLVKYVELKTFFLPRHSCTNLAGMNNTDYYIHSVILGVLVRHLFNANNNKKILTDTRKNVDDYTNG